MKWIRLETTTPLPLELVQILVAHSQPYAGPLAVLQWSAYVESYLSVRWQTQPISTWLWLRRDGSMNPLVRLKTHNGIFHMILSNLQTCVSLYLTLHRLPGPPSW